MSLEKKFEKTWNTVSEEQNTIDPVTDKKIWANITYTIRKKKRIRNLYWTAAAVIPFFIFLILYNHSQKGTGIPEKNLVYESFKSSKNIRLPDGSIIQLMPYSKLILSENFGSKNREISFKGQGNFKIAKDKTKPFRIHTEDFHVQVLGTHFFLDQKSIEKKVELFEGKVKVEHLGKVTYLLPEEIWISGNGYSDYHYYNREKQKSFTFDHSKYADAIEQLENTYNVRISFPDQYRNRIISGSFTGNLNDIITIISYPFNLKIEKNNATEIQLK